MARTLEQQIAETEAKLERLRQREKAKDTRCKIVFGALIMTEALKDPAGARKLAHLAETKITRDVDKAAVAEFLEELRRVHGGAQEAKPAA